MVSGDPVALDGGDFPVELMATLATPDLSTWLRKFNGARVLHVFPAACNLTRADSAVLSIVCRLESMGPFSLLVSLGGKSAESDFQFVDRIQDGSLVTVAPEKLTIGPVSIWLREAKTWNPKPPWESIPIERLAVSRPVMYETLKATAPLDSMAGFY